MKTLNEINSLMNTLYRIGVDKVSTKLMLDELTKIAEHARKDRKLFDEAHEALIGIEVETEKALGFIKRNKRT